MSDLTESGNPIPIEPGDKRCKETRCKECGSPLDGPSQCRCVSCHEVHREQARLRLKKCSEWKPGGRGRPPEDKKGQLALVLLGRALRVVESTRWIRRPEWLRLHRTAANLLQSVRRLEDKSV
jgi:hypothetical protein